MAVLIRRTKKGLLRIWSKILSFVLAMSGIHTIEACSSIWDIGAPEYMVALYMAPANTQISGRVIEKNDFNENNIKDGIPNVRVTLSYSPYSVSGGQQQRIVTTDEHGNYYLYVYDDIQTGTITFADTDDNNVVFVTDNGETVPEVSLTNIPEGTFHDAGTTEISVSAVPQQ